MEYWSIGFEYITPLLQGHIEPLEGGIPYSETP
jgi:hypothetical protein